MALHSANCEQRRWDKAATRKGVVSRPPGHLDAASAASLVKPGLHRHREVQESASAGDPLPPLRENTSPGHRTVERAEGTHTKWFQQKGAAGQRSTTDAGENQKQLAKWLVENKY